MSGKKRLRAKQGQKTLRAFKLGEGLPNLTSLADELQDMTDVLMGRKTPPVSAVTTLALMEVADAYYSRAAEVTMMIQRLEREGRIDKGDAHYKFRTGELRTFMELAKRAADLGSRRLTEEDLTYRKTSTGRESKETM